MRKEMGIYRISLVATVIALVVITAPTGVLAAGGVLDIPGGGLAVVFLKLTAWILQIGLAVAILSVFVSASQRFRPGADKNNLLAIKHDLFFFLLVAIAALAGLVVLQASGHALLP